MSPLHAGAAVIGLLGVAGWALVNGLRRAPSSVRAARLAMHQQVSGSRRTAEGLVGERGQRWMAARHGDDLVVLETSAAALVSRMLTAAVLMGAIVGLGVAGLVGVGLLSVPALAVPPVAALMAAWTMDRGVTARASARRAVLRRAANDFVQLVAIGLTTDQSVEEAIRFALEVGAGDGFVELRREVEAAPMRGLTVWDAIDEVGQRFGVRELSEFAASVERQGMQGVAIGDTVSTIASSMRAKALDQLERDAERANANLAGPTIGFVVATVVFLAYPLAQRISDAFGG